MSPWMSLLPPPLSFECPPPPPGCFQQNISHVSTPFYCYCYMTSTASLGMMHCARMIKVHWSTNWLQAQCMIFWVWSRRWRIKKLLRKGKKGALKYFELTQGTEHVSSRVGSQRWRLNRSLERKKKVFRVTVTLPWNTATKSNVTIIVDT